jgi:hypothetical protein
MNPILKSYITTVVAGAASAVVAWAVAHGIIPGADQSVLANDLAGAAGIGVFALITWIKGQMHTKTAQIVAVNKADNGVKVVAESSPSPKVDVPLK